MIAAIILAAGSARRMGRQKLLLPIGKRKLIEHIVREVTGACVDDCIVVTGSDAEEVSGLIKALPARVVFNDEHISGGMLSSVRCGLSSAHPQTTGFLICLGDQPDTSSLVIGNMLREVKKSQPEILVPTYKGKRGHPLYFKSSYAEQVMESYDDVGLKGLLREFSGHVVEWPLDTQSILIDLDTPDDYQRWLKLHDPIR